MIADWSLMCQLIRNDSRELYEQLNRKRGEPDDQAERTAQDILFNAAKLYALVKNGRV